MTEPIVRVSRLTKVFKSFRREEGLAAALKSLVKRTTTETAAVADVTFAVTPTKNGLVMGTVNAPAGVDIVVFRDEDAKKVVNRRGAGDDEHRALSPRTTRYVATIGVVFGQRTQLWWDIAVVESFRLLKEIYGLTDAQ